MNDDLDIKNKIMKRFFIFLLFTVIIWLFPDTAEADDWPRWRGPRGNSISNEKGWNPNALDGGAKILWKINVGKGYSSVSVKSGYLYTMGNIDDKDIVYCLNAKTGEEVWRFAYDAPVKNWGGPFSTPLIDGGHVYTLSRKGDLYCLFSGNGQKRWSADITSTEYGATKPKYGFSSSPVIDGNKIILNACKHGLAVDKNTGKKIWASPPGKCGYATPVFYTFKGKKCAAIFAHRRINGVDLETGELLWDFPWIFNDGADAPDPVVVGNRVFISTAYGNGGTMLEFTSNNKRANQHWFRKDLQNEFGSSIYIDGYLYVPQGDTRHSTAYLKCVNFDTGKDMWTRDTGHCSLIYVDGKFIVLNQWGELLFMEASEKGYKDLSRAKVIQTSSKVRCWTAPVLADGSIYIRTNTGDLVCVDVSRASSSVQEGVHHLGVGASGSSR